MITVIFKPDGSIRHLACPQVDFSELGTVKIRRASHIWPANPFVRLAFRAIRFVFGDRGRLAEWSRHWRCCWTVRLSEDPGRVVFSSQSRRACLAWERAYFESVMIAA